MTQKEVGQKVKQYKALTTLIKDNMGYEKAPAEMSDAELADFIVHLRGVKSLVEAREKLLSEVLKSRFQPQIDELLEMKEGQPKTYWIEGEATPGLDIVPVTQRRFDSDAVKEEMGPEWYEEHCKTIQFVQLKASKG